MSCQHSVPVAASRHWTVPPSRFGPLVPMVAHVDYGDVDGIAGLIEDIAARRGIGDILAAGIRAAAAEWGLQDQAIHVKGLEPAGYDPRVLKGMGLAYGVSDRGACQIPINTTADIINNFS